jgi:hypothetical protein
MWMNLEYEVYTGKIESRDSYEIYSEWCLS